MIRQFRSLIPVSSLILLISDVLAVAASFVLVSYKVTGVNPADYLIYDGGLFNIVLVVASIVLCFYFQDLYSHLRVQSWGVLVQQLCMAFGLAFLVQGATSYLDRNLRMPLRIMVYGSTLALVVMFLWRIFFSAYLLATVGRQRVLLVGVNSVVREIAAYIDTQPQLGIQIVGYLNEEEPESEPIAQGKFLGPIARLREVVEAVQPDRILVGLSERRGRMPIMDLLEFRLAGYLVEEAATAYERIFNRVSIPSLRPSHLVFSGEMGPRRKNYISHILFDTGVAVIAVIITLPVMLLIVLVSKLSFPGPVLYRQKRVGRGGQLFSVLKFRTMDDNPDDPANPHTTWFGTFLRNSRLNELPQLFNVMRGEMSIVGPRPERPEYVKAFCEKIPYYGQRHCVRPGITGWAQINHLHADSVEETMTKLSFDLYYIKHMSQTLDLVIMFQTIKILLLSRGAG